MGKRRKRSCRTCGTDMTGVMPGSARYCGDCKAPSDYERKPCRDCGGLKPPHPYNKSYCPGCVDRHASEQSSAMAQRKRAARYDLTVDELNELLAIGECEVCGRSDVRFCVDHDHETGKVRGLLCDYCNKALGMAQDSPEILRKLARYLDDRAE